MNYLTSDDIEFLKDSLEAYFNHAHDLLKEPTTGENAKNNLSDIKTKCNFLTTKLNSIEEEL